MEVDGSVVYEEEISPVDPATQSILDTLPVDPHPVVKNGCPPNPAMVIGEAMKMDFEPRALCTHGWIEVLDDACDQCEGNDMFHKVDGKWEQAASCLYDRLSRDTCVFDGTELTQTVMCVIWPNDRVLAAIHKTGCIASRDDVTAAIEESCERWTNWEEHMKWSFVPMGNCVFGWSIREFQRKLVNLGYATNTDGFFGAMSARSVLNFQRSKGLLLTASFDEPTRLAVLAE
ncbi:MAG: peptidoglycan-binding domain-containing protein [Actinomycetota bacterium]